MAAKMLASARAETKLPLHSSPMRKLPSGTRTTEPWITDGT